MLSKREWEQIKLAIQVMRSAVINNPSFVDRVDVLELLEQWVEEDDE